MNSGPDNSLIIQSAPPTERAAAIEMVLRDATPLVRASLAASEAAQSGLWTASRDGNLVGSIWFNVQPGRTAAVWPPRLRDNEPPATALALLTAAVTELDRQAIQLLQVLLPNDIEPDAELLRRAGFTHLADLLYLFSSTEKNSPKEPSSSLEFERVEDVNSARLAEIVERTYEASRDCPQLNGARNMDDIIAGYLATGDSQAEYWRIVRHDHSDVGCLLLADHPEGDNLELVYMGLVPAARGRGWGADIVAHAQRMTQQAGRANLVLAVDAANNPALAMYYGAGMIEWERRSVFTRLLTPPTMPR